MQAWETSVKDEDIEVGRVTNVSTQKHITHDQLMPDAMIQCTLRIKMYKMNSNNLILIFHWLN